jgi:hypothetical protein
MVTVLAIDLSWNAKKLCLCVSCYFFICLNFVGNLW